LSIQIAILKILASHGNGHAALNSLKHDLAILESSGADWQLRIRRLASRAPNLDIFSDGYVLRDAEGWQITPDGREFLRALEAVTQDNLPPAEPSQISSRAPGTLIVVGHRFKNRTRASRDVAHSASGRHGPRPKNY
jgi:hypothetical protein